jgi:hypothetical protein
MHTENMWIVILLLIVILVGANAAMFALVRGSKSMDWKSFGQLGNPKETLQKEEKDWEELSRQIRSMKVPPDQEE